MDPNAFRSLSNGVPAPNDDLNNMQYGERLGAQQERQHVVRMQQLQQQQAQQQPPSFHNMTRTGQPMSSRNNSMQRSSDLVPPTGVLPSDTNLRMKDLNYFKDVVGLVQLRRLHHHGHTFEVYVPFFPQNMGFVKTAAESKGLNTASFIVQNLAVFQHLNVVCAQVPAWVKSPVQQPQPASGNVPVVHPTVFNVSVNPASGQNAQSGSMPQSPYRNPQQGASQSRMFPARNTGVMGAASNTAQHGHEKVVIDLTSDDMHAVPVQQPLPQQRASFPQQQGGAFSPPQMLSGMASSDSMSCSSMTSQKQSPGTSSAARPVPPRKSSEAGWFGAQARDTASKISGGSSHNRFIVKNGKAKMTQPEWTEKEWDEYREKQALRGEPGLKRKSGEVDGNEFNLSDQRVNKSARTELHQDVAGGSAQLTRTDAIPTSAGAESITVDSQVTDASATAETAATASGQKKEQRPAESERLEQEHLQHGYEAPGGSKPKPKPRVADVLPDDVRKVTRTGSELKGVKQTFNGDNKGMSALELPFLQDSLTVARYIYEDGTVIFRLEAKLDQNAAQKLMGLKKAPRPPPAPAAPAPPVAIGSPAFLSAMSNLPASKAWRPKPPKPHSREALGEEQWADRVEEQTQLLKEKSVRLRNGQWVGAGLREVQSKPEAVHHKASEATSLDGGVDEDDPLASDLYAAMAEDDTDAAGPSNEPIANVSPAGTPVLGHRSGDAAVPSASARGVSVSKYSADVSPSSTSSAASPGTPTPSNEPSPPDHQTHGTPVEMDVFGETTPATEYDGFEEAAYASLKPGSSGVADDGELKLFGSDELAAWRAEDAREEATNNWWSSPTSSADKVNDAPLGEDEDLFGEDGDGNLVDNSTPVAGVSTARTSMARVTNIDHCKKRKRSDADDETSLPANKKASKTPSLALPPMNGNDAGNPRLALPKGKLALPKSIPGRRH